MIDVIDIWMAAEWLAVDVHWRVIDTIIALCSSFNNEYQQKGCIEEKEKGRKQEAFFDENASCSAFLYIVSQRHTSRVSIKNRYPLDEEDEALQESNGKTAIKKVLIILTVASHFLSRLHL